MEKTFFGHPRGLATLFFTELWERFSYYGMRALLVLFLTAAMEDGGFGMDASLAGAIYGLYTFGVYAMALPGGWVADRILGQRQAVFLGGCVIAAGHFSMAVPTTTTFYLGLILIVLGTGLLKPNVSAIVGDLYPEGGARRDAGFSIFYMGINLGAFIGPILCGLLGEGVDWHLGFGLAGIGMLFGLIQYKMGWSYLAGAGELPQEAQGTRPAAIRKLILGVVASGIVVATLLGLHFSGTVSMTLGEVATGLGYAVCGLAVLYFASIILFAGLDGTERKRVFVIFLLFVASALFWAGFEQAGSSMNLFAAHLTDRSLLGTEVPASVLQAINPIFIIALAPVFGWLWVALGRRNPSMPLKFAYGLFLLGVGFLVMKWASLRAVGEAVYTESNIDTGEGPAVNLVGPYWLIATYFLHTCGELCLSPVGLSSVTKLAPQRLVGQMMGTWFIGVALGNLVAGLVASQFETLPLADLFGSVAWIVLWGGAAFLLLSWPIRKLMGGVE